MSKHSRMFDQLPGADHAGLPNFQHSSSIRLKPRFDYYGSTRGTPPESGVPDLTRVTVLDFDRRVQGGFDLPISSATMTD